MQPWGAVSKDAAIAEVLKVSDQRIALAFRIPLQILGIGGTPYSSAELLMQSWIALGLGFALNHIEESFGQLYQLRGVPEEYVEFDTEALLRSSLKERIDVWLEACKVACTPQRGACERRSRQSQIW